MMLRFCHSVVFFMILGILCSGCASNHDASDIIAEAIFETVVALLSEDSGSAEATTVSNAYAYSPIVEVCGYSEPELIVLEDTIDQGKPLPYLRYGISSAQVSWLMLFYADERDRVDAAITMYRAVCDKDNWYVVYNSITSFENRLALERALDPDYAYSKSEVSDLFKTDYLWIDPMNQSKQSQHVPWFKDSNMFNIDIPYSISH